MRVFTRGVALERSRSAASFTFIALPSRLLLQIPAATAALVTWTHPCMTHPYMTHPCMTHRRLILLCALSNRHLCDLRPGAGGLAKRAVHLTPVVFDCSLIPQVNYGTEVDGTPQLQALPDGVGAGVGGARNLR